MFIRKKIVSYELCDCLSSKQIMFYVTDQSAGLCNRMYQNICVEPHPSQYQNGFEILSCPDIYPVCEYNTEYEGNIEPFECQVSTTLYFENLKYQSKTSE